MAETTKSDPKPPLPRWRRVVNWIGWFCLDQWYIFAMAVVIIISSQVQVPKDKQQLRQTVVTYGAVAAIFFITGCTLKTKILIDNYWRWKIHLFSQVQSFLMTSAIVFGVVTAAGTNEQFMDPGLLIGMIFLGSVPTTLSSNVVMTAQAHGNTALTVVQTTVGNFIGPFLSPLLVKMYISTGAWYTDYLHKAEAAGGGFGEIYRRVFMQLGFSVYLPMVIGQVVHNLFPGACNRVFNEWKLKKFGSICLLIINWQTFDQAFATGAFTSVKPSNIIFVVFMNIAFFFIWLVIAFTTSVPWLPRADVVSMAYCIPAKTPAMGVPLSNVMFAGLSLLVESKMQIRKAMILFQQLQITFSSLLTIPLRKWVDQEEVGNDAEEGTHRAATQDGTASDSEAERATVADQKGGSIGKMNEIPSDNEPEKLKVVDSKVDQI